MNAYTGRIVYGVIQDTVSILVLAHLIILQSELALVTLVNDTDTVKTRGPVLEEFIKHFRAIIGDEYLVMVMDNHSVSKRSKSNQRLGYAYCN